MVAPVLDDPGRLEVLLSANAMKAGMAILGPLLAATGAPKQVKMVICAIKGNIYDIGKEPGGHDVGGCRFRRDRLGINNPVENYLNAIEEHRPDIIGMSALLTTTMPRLQLS
jgi:methanogenic corrinoid protein MtbC1